MLPGNTHVTQSDKHPKFPLSSYIHISLYTFVIVLLKPRIIEPLTSIDTCRSVNTKFIIYVLLITAASIKLHDSTLKHFTMADELDYLQPSFEPSSVTMPKLRNILMTNDIPYPASAKKGELVDIFNQHLKPKARRILAARDRVRRTSEGITYVPSSQESSTSGDLDDRNSMPPPPIPPTPRQRKSKKAGRPESEERNLTSSDRRTPSTGRNASNKHGRQSDTEPEADISRPAARKSRKSEITPKTRVDQPASASRPKMPEGVFSNDNPFQRGSPPSDATDHRRRTAGASVDKRKSSSSRRRTEGALPRNPSLEQSDGAVVPSSKTFEVPVSRLRGKQPKKDSHGEIEAGEEFTPEAQLELDNEQDLSGGQDVTTSRKRKATHTHATVPKSIPWLVVATLLGGYATWYRQEKLAVGYCGIGRPSVTVSNVHIPDWADVFRPACELCPQHATCYENLDTECSDGFILRDHPFSLGGLVPLPPTCEPDGEKARKVKAVADRGVNYLRDRNAQAVCGTFKDSEGNPEAQAIPERQLKEAVKQQKRKGMSESEFDNIWKGAFEEIIGREEVSHEQSAQG